MAVLLEAEHLAAGYGLAEVLFDVNLKIGEGDVVTLLGRNGMGKTTTIRVLMGLLQPRGGNRFAQPGPLGELLKLGRPVERLAQDQERRPGANHVECAGDRTSIRGPITARIKHACHLNRRHGLDCS